MIITEGKNLGKLLRAFAQEMSELENNLLRLLTEMIPGLSDWLLDRWESVLNIFPSGSADNRRQAVQNKFTLKFENMSEQFYIGLAAGYGATITINAVPGGGGPFRVDENRVDRTPELGVDGARLNSNFGIRSYWEVKIPTSAQNKNLVVQELLKYKPLHTILIITEV